MPSWASNSPGVWAAVATKIALRSPTPAAETDRKEQFVRPRRQFAQAESPPPRAYRCGRPPQPARPDPSSDCRGTRRQPERRGRGGAQSTAKSGITNSLVSKSTKRLGRLTSPAVRHASSANASKGASNLIRLAPAFEMRHQKADRQMSQDRPAARCDRHRRGDVVVHVDVQTAARKHFARIGGVKSKVASP